MGTPTPEMIQRAAEAKKAKDAARKAAAEQAAKDAAVKPQPPEYKAVVGQKVPLHVLNTRAREEDRSMADVRRKAAMAAAQAVNQTLAKENQTAAVKARKGKPAAGPNTANAPVAPPPPRTTATGPRPAAAPEAPDGDK